MPDPQDQPKPLIIRFGPDEVVIRRRYEALSIANDILIGLWFIVGSFLFFGESTAYAGTWLFVTGSIEMLIRPVIRLARQVHLRRYQPSADSASAADF